MGWEARTRAQGRSEAEGVRWEHEEPENGRGLESNRLARREGLWTRRDVAEFLSVSTRTVQRLEERGILRRCPGLRSAVRFPVGDVRKLASADWKEI
jgi:hypothetical protein